MRIESVKVLVLDDHRFMQQVLRAILFGLGMRRVTMVSSTEEALEALSLEPFDLIIADYRLREASGAEFTRLVRGARNGTDRFIPIIACTADGTRKVIKDFRDAGADEILVKPVSPRSVCDKITAVVERRRRFINSGSFFGPDRRRRRSTYSGPERRTEIEL